MRARSVATVVIAPTARSGLFESHASCTTVATAPPLELPPLFESVDKEVSSVSTATVGTSISRSVGMFPSFIERVINALNLANEATSTTPANAAFALPGCGQHPKATQGILGVASKGQVSLSRLTIGRPCPRIRKSSPLQPRVLWARSGKPGDRTMKMRIEMDCNPWA